MRDLEIDVRARLVLLAGEPIALTQREFALLVDLASEPERVFTKAELMDQIWGYPADCTTRTLDSHACRLRHKLGVHGDRSWVLNVPGLRRRHAASTPPTWSHVRWAAVTRPPAWSRCAAPPPRLR